MKERLQSLMNLKKMTPSQFADSIGIQRSTLHHIISGRNNPSVDVINKIHSTYPDVDLNWLISGDAKPSSPVIQKELFSNEDEDSVQYNKEVVNINNKSVSQIIVVYNDGSTETFFH